MKEWTAWVLIAGSGVFIVGFATLTIVGLLAAFGFDSDAVVSGAKFGGLSVVGGFATGLLGYKLDKLFPLNKGRRK